MSGVTINVVLTILYALVLLGNVRCLGMSICVRYSDTLCSSSSIRCVYQSGERLQGVKVLPLCFRVTKVTLHNTLTPQIEYVEFASLD